MAGIKGSVQIWNVRWMRYIYQEPADSVAHSWRMVGDKLVAFCGRYSVLHLDSDFSEFDGFESKPPKSELCPDCFDSDIWTDLEQRRITKRY
jgi:hypothetical protein